MKRFFSTSFIFLTIAMLILSAPATLSINAKANAKAAQPNINAWGEFASGNVKRGKSVQGKVIMDIPGGLHTHSNKPYDKYLIPTKLEVFPPNGVRVGAVIYPTGKIVKLGFSNSKLSVYEGRTTLKFNVTVPANYSGGEIAIKAKLRYQACSDSECYAPASKEVWLKAGVQ